MSISKVSMSRTLNGQRLGVLAGVWLLACLPALANPAISQQAPVLLAQQRVRNVSLRYGDSGPAVVQLQRALDGRGLYPYNYDGIYGDNTRQAVRQFQRIRRLEVTGLADTATLRALDVDPVSVLSRMVHPVHGDINDEQLQFGDESRDVTILQRVLNSFGFGLPTTGYYGSETQQAVRAYQRTAGLEDNRGNVSGIADRETLIHLGFEPTGSFSEESSFVAAVIAGESELRRVRRDFPNAVLVDDGRLGDYISLGRYDKHSLADDQADRARSYGYDARVLKD
ncbi:MAG: peptidoglycan-binding protein [Cyanobacteria bacterium P01_B01_bin.77]